MKPKKGIVISDKMDKTIVVQVSRLKKHSKYKKYYKIDKKYKVHDPKNKFKVGDKIEFIDCKPISKGKKFKIYKNDTNRNKTAISR